MNKSQTILAAIGGTAAVGALVLGYLIWDASSANGEKSDGLDGKVASARGVMKKLPVKPDAAELKVFAENVAVYDAWRAEAEKIAARGDLVFEPTTPAVFKTTLVNDARRLAALPGCHDGAFAKSDFGFGFKDYVTGGAMPPEAELKRLQREWNDVAYVLRTLAECGGAGIGVTGVTVGKAKAEVVEEEPTSRKKGKAGRNAKAKGKAKAEAETEAGPEISAFTVEFLARPAALVKALNALSTGTRFVVVENCTFVRESDALATALGGGEAKNSERTSRRRPRRGQQEEEKEESKAGLVTDPATAPMLKVTMVLSVYDFGTLERAKAEAEAEAKTGAKEGEAK